MVAFGSVDGWRVAKRSSSGSAENDDPKSLQRWDCGQISIAGKRKTAG
jgi:hypothetical protein